MAGAATTRKRLQGMIEERMKLLQSGIYDGTLDKQTAENLCEDVKLLGERYIKVSEELMKQHEIWKEVEKIAKLRTEIEHMVGKADAIERSVAYYIQSLQAGLYDMEALEASLSTNIQTLTEATVQIKKDNVEPAETSVKQPLSKEVHTEDGAIKKKTVPDADMLAALMEEAGNTYKQIRERYVEAGGEVAYPDITYLPEPPRHHPQTTEPAYTGIQKREFRPEMISTPAVDEPYPPANRFLPLKSDSELAEQDLEKASLPPVTPITRVQSSRRDEYHGGEAGRRDARGRLQFYEDPENEESDESYDDERPIEQKFLTRRKKKSEMGHEDTSLAGKLKVNETFGGDDLARYLTKIPLKKFSGNKRQFNSWWTAFSTCVDQANVKDEVKLLKLKDCLEGEALETVDSLGFSASAYAIAKSRLNRKFGGKHRQLNMYYSDLMDFKPLKEDTGEELERLAETLDRLVVYLQDNGEDQELGGGTLYAAILRKLTKAMVTRFQRWLHENRKIGTVTVLHEYINQEAEYVITASENVQGMSGGKKKEKPRTMTGLGTQKMKEDKKKTDLGKTKKVTGENRSCTMCGGSHGIWACKTFLDLSVNDRWMNVREKKLCHKCLQAGHYIDTCGYRKNCGMAGCTLRHNLLLHNTEAKSMKGMEKKENSGTTPEIENKNVDSEEQGKNQKKGDVIGGQEKTAAGTYHGHGNALNDMCYRTVPVIMEYNGRQVKISALLDDASNVSYLTNRVASYLKLEGADKMLEVKVIGDKIEKFPSREVTCTMKSVDGKEEFEFHAQTVKELAPSLRVVNFNRVKEQWKHLVDIAFPEIVSTKVDALIGIEYAYQMRSIMDVAGGPGDPIARLTPLGWTCIASRVAPGPQTFYTFHGMAQGPLEMLLKRYWEIEDGPSGDPYTIEERRAIEIVADSIRYIDGRYQVSLPWKDGRPEELNNYYQALKKLIALERRLLKKPALAAQYQEVFEDYKAQGIIRKIQCSFPWKLLAWFLSHFPVVREEVATTKVRIVFNASEECNGVSLNDLLLVGPAYQQPVPQVLNRFRKNKNGFITDIQKMYLQILMDPKDQPFQSFLWRDLKTDRELEVYQFTRVMFGVNCSPFLAQFVSRHNAMKFVDQFPRAVDVILLSTYMDDSQDSMSGVTDTIQLAQEVDIIWKHAGMKPHKWLSNSAEVLATIPEKSRATSVDLLRHELPKTKTLGMAWYPTEDKLAYVVAVLDCLYPATKRRFLKILATIYDPLGLVVPVIMVGRILLQRIWERGYDWDEEITGGLQKEMNLWIEELKELGELRIDRVLLPEDNYQNIQLHGFGDSSEEAYGGVIYLRTVTEDNEVRVVLVMAKGKVTPLKAITMPRLELMASQILARLAISVSIYLQISDVEVFLWTDSVDCLYWVKSVSKSLKSFVGHRVAEIQDLFSPSVWRYVETFRNPADLLSRGMRVRDIRDSELWFTGPDFLYKEKDQWPQFQIEEGYDLKEKKKDVLHAGYAFYTTTSLTYQAVNVTEMVKEERFSSWTRLIRVVACLHSAREKLKKRRKNGEIQAEDETWATLELIKSHQQRSFAAELKILESLTGKEIGARLAGLNPWLDIEGVLRSNTRLADSALIPWHTKYPVILAGKDHITELIVKYYHEKAKHGGTGLTLALLNEKFWLLSAREEIQKWERKCMSCRKAKKNPVVVKMGPLPEFRTRKVNYAFQLTSMDYAGPFYTKQGRGKARLKRYICLYTCLSVRAVHLEMVWDMTTDAFLLSFSRFCAQQNRPEEVYSDNGSNFVGGERALHELRACLDEKKIQEYGSTRGIKWHFQPPLAPHFSGVHESLVKSSKRALYQTLSAAVVTDEELLTVITEVSNLMNQRPLTYQSANPADSVPLTPSHFLVGKLNPSLSPEAQGTTSDSLARRWSETQDLLDEYWKRWQREWLTQLSPRRKWVKIGEELKIGDAVQVVDTSLPRGSWLLGRIEQVYPGKDGLVRVVDVKTSTGILKRPAVRIVKLM